VEPDRRAKVNGNNDILRCSCSIPITLSGRSCRRWPVFHLSFRVQEKLRRWPIIDPLVACASTPARLHPWLSRAHATREADRPLASLRLSPTPKYKTPDRSCAWRYESPPSSTNLTLPHRRLHHLLTPTSIATNDCPHP
jgi:hypothetical protein